MNLPANTKVIACEVFKDELTYLGLQDDDCVYLDQGLHRYPEDFRQKMESSIKKIEEEYNPENIILVCGFCGGGLEDVCSQRSALILPKAHDCIAVFLGNEPQRIGKNGKGIYYLSRGWIKYGHPFFLEYEDFIDRFGREDTHYVLAELFKTYESVAFIHTLDSGTEEDLAAEAKKIAEMLNMKHFELKGGTDFLEKLISGQEGKEIIKLAPGSKISRHYFRLSS